VSHVSGRGKDEQHDELMAAVADGVALGLREMLPELEKRLPLVNFFTDLVEAQAKAVRASAMSARSGTR
jgi:hypothetical protein